jgi:hypothetical protein
MNYLIDSIYILKDKLASTVVEKELLDAMNNEEWSASNTLLYKLAERTNDTEDCTIILQKTIANLRAPESKWRSLYKTLVLIELLLKTGSIRCV